MAAGSGIKRHDQPAASQESTIRMVTWYGTYVGRACDPAFSFIIYPSFSILFLICESSFNSAF